MKIDVIYEKGTLCEFKYSPLYEMFCAMHVLSSPEHHLHRKQWVQKVQEKIDNKFLQDIVKFGEHTNQYCIVMDFCNLFEECNDLSIPSAIEFLSNVSIYKINRIFKDYEKRLSHKEYLFFLDLLKRFYVEVFQEELKYIEPIITRVLKREAVLGREKGIFNLVDTIHERIKLSDEKIVFIKNKEYVVNREKLKCITIYSSTFISPHLMIGIMGDNLYLTHLIDLGSYEKESPLDLEKTLKALGDNTRLKILKEISKKGKSTQELSKILSISEAAVSKALKIMQEGNLVIKERRGNYIIYSINSTEIDYIPYKIYEYIMMT
ncbi:ArsR/SmtB family transcription factor [Clostridium paridis]|uniref:Winged helix-turn-helix transcriptional regulator n=1 Tax=Clostridium paridis TaxID=2803863 RepID=A0A937FH48_9CLOT|nr:metalloregulator ArsR/SmtB family transcription factor [Clostridium paridis]MBL4931867.1 winged helix-turn-helix transcriptional regulator [Clostridium paridis]